MRIRFLSFSLTFFLLFIFNNLQAQRFGFYDGQLILNQMPEYAQAKTEMSGLIEKWKIEIDEVRESLSKLRREYIIDKALLTTSMRKVRETEILEKEKEFREKQSSTFGYKGLKHLREDVLFKPLDVKLSKAVRKVSRKKRVNIMFDKSADLIIIYGNKRYNYTKQILEELGLTLPTE
jgi:outer membrane protein